MTEKFQSLFLTHNWNQNTHTTNAFQYTTLLSLKIAYSKYVSQITKHKMGAKVKGKAIPVTDRGGP
jgi:hypothetical protein